MDEDRDRSPGTRDAVRQRVGRVKRWVLGGAVALTGVFSAVAAEALPASHSKSRTTPTPPTTVPGAAPSVDEAPVPRPTPDISPPTQAPQPSSAGSGAVSGGS